MFSPFRYLLAFAQKMNTLSYTLEHVEVLGASLDDLLEGIFAGSSLAPLERMESRVFFMVKRLRHLR